MKLTDKYISNLKHLDNDQFFSQEGTEGLTLRIYKFAATCESHRLTSFDCSTTHP